MKKGMDFAKKEAITFLESISVDLQESLSRKLIWDLALVATNFNEELSELLTEFFIEIGP